MRAIQDIFNGLFNLGIVHQNTSLNVLRQKTINIFNTMFLSIMTITVLIRVLNGQLGIAAINLIAMSLIALALFFSYKGKLSVAVVISCLVLTLLTFALAYIGLLKPLQIVPQLALIMVTFIIIIGDKKVRYTYIALCLVLLFLISLKHGFAASASIPIVIQSFGFALAFNYFVNFLESQDKSLNNAIAELKELNTKKEELNKTLYEKNGELTTFSHIMGHDLKTPLMSIIAFAKLIERKVHFEENIGKYFEYITKSAVSMQTLIEDLLLYAKVGADVSLEFVKVDLNELIDDLLLIYKYEIINKEVAFEVGKLPEVTGNQQLLRTLFHNLISNAIKYQPKCKPNYIPKISINSSDDSNYHFIIVSDNGIGIKEEYIENLFTPFKRFHTNSEYEGTGLGMSICRKVMQKHGSSIELLETSTNGSKFKLAFKKSKQTLNKVTP